MTLTLLPSNSTHPRRAVFAAVSMALACALAAVPLVASEALAQSDDAYIGYRQTLMEGIGSQMGAISDILKYGLPLTASIQGHARAMAALAELVPAGFEHKVTEGRTDAKAAIWADAPAFEKAGADFVAATTKLVEIAGAADAGAIGAQLEAVGKTCGGCHKQFRKPKEESFKSQDDDSDSH
ncbi:MAG: cytochrome c [Myxococcales bacterium]|nr:MAG: cytochrome c [Myxococcales bacterium]